MMANESVMGVRKGCAGIRAVVAEELEVEGPPIYCVFVEGVAEGIGR